jgi:hypothetical protein
VLSCVLETFRRDDIGVLIVWIPMLVEDSEQAARASSEMFVDAGAGLFYDGNRRAGRAVAAALGSPGEIAWDMYLAYPGDAEWEGDGVPAPASFTHQLPRGWADPSRYRTGDDLHVELRMMVARLVG